jgi:hypothetical protein
MLNVVTLYFTKPRNGDHSQGRQNYWVEQGPTYLRRLHAGCCRHIKEPFWFYVITDNPDVVRDALAPHIGATVVPLVVGDKEDVPGWWMKLKMFDPRFALEGRTLYLDLDNVISGDLSPLLALPLTHAQPLIMANDRVHEGMANGSTMFCLPERLRALWTWYEMHPAVTRETFSVWPNASDQAYIADYMKGPYWPKNGLRLFQDLLPHGYLLNSRVELEQGADWSQTALVYGSWNPKPHMSTHPFYAQHWID